MRLPRYTQAQSQGRVTAELQSAKDVMIKPAEAVAGEVRKFGAITSVAEATGRVVAKVEEVRIATEQAEDNVDYENNENDLTNKIKLLSVDLDQNAKDAGLSSQDYYKREMDVLLADYRSGAAGFKNVATQKRANENIGRRVEKELADSEIEQYSIKLRATTEKLNGGLVAATEAKNPEGIRNLVKTGLEDGLIVELQAGKWNAVAKSIEDDTEAQTYIDEVNQAFSYSERDGQKALMELMRTELDPDVKKIAVAGANLSKNKWNTARVQKTEDQDAQATLVFGKMLRKAGNGEGSEEEFAAELRSERIGKGDKGAGRFNQLMSALSSGVEKRGLEIDVAKAIQDGSFLPPGKKYRDAQAVYEANVTDGMSSEDRWATIVSISQSTGSVSTATEQKLNQGGISKEAGDEGYYLYKALMSHSDLRPALHINEKAMAVYENMDFMLSGGGMTTEFARMTAWEQIELDPLAKEARSEAYEAFAQDEGASAGGSYAGKMSYKVHGWKTKPPLIGVEVKRNYEMENEYQAIYKINYMLTGNPRSAENMTNHKMAGLWSYTNINSDNGSYEFMRGDLPSDSSNIRKEWIKELTTTGRTYQIQGYGANRKVKDPDPSKITFIKMGEDYKVQYDGVPIEEASTGADVEVDGKTEYLQGFLGVAMEVNERTIYDTKLKADKKASLERKRWENEQKRQWLVDKNKKEWGDVPKPLRIKTKELSKSDKKEIKQRERLTESYDRDIERITF